MLYSSLGRPFHKRELERGLTDTCKFQKFGNIEDARIFEVVDTPGHRYYSDQFMRGLAMADAAVLLFDASKDSKAKQ